MHYIAKKDYFFSDKMSKEPKGVSANKENIGENCDFRENEKSEKSASSSKYIGLDAGSYWLTRTVFLRFIAFIYLTGFSVAFWQNKELIGVNGLTPLKLYLAREEFEKYIRVHTYSNLLK